MIRRINRSATSILLIVSLLLLVLVSLPAYATLNISAPVDGYIAEAELCPTSPCTAKFGYPDNLHPAFEVYADGLPIDFLYFDITKADGSVNNHLVCRPEDPIEGTDDCHALPFYFSDPLVLSPGQYTVVARAMRGSNAELSSPISVTVLAPNDPLAGAISLTAVTPLIGTPSLTLAGEYPDIPLPVPLPDPLPDDYPEGLIFTAGSEILITGENLHNNPFLRVFLVPIPTNEQSINEFDPLPVTDWCMYEATITNREVNLSGESTLLVRLPNLPLTSAVLCRVISGAEGSIFNLQWRWVIKDEWQRPQRTHSHYAIPSPRNGSPWEDAPSFALVKPNYASIDGFGFANHGTDASYDEFLTVYGNNAYLCVGAFGLCATRIPDPIYHTLWYGIYSLAIDNTGGSCNGLSATSLLFHHEILQPEDYEPDVHFPFGFKTPGSDSVTAYDKDGNAYQKGVAHYRDSNWCTPFCSPPKVDNFWAEVRKNHGVQLSREFLKEMFSTLGKSLVDVGDISTLSDVELFQGIPNATLAKVRANPTGNVLCFSEFGGGHCVTPYAVDGNSIKVYDNNSPGNVSRNIDIIAGDYDYSQRSDPPNHGNFIIAYPLDLWLNGRKLFGLGDALSVNSTADTLEFLSMILSGSADMTLSNDNGERYGWEDDDSFSNSMPGVFSSSLFGPSDEPQRNGLFLVSEPSSAADIIINADGGFYAFHTGSGDQLLQLQAAHANAGDKDLMHLQFSEGIAYGFEFQPQRSADALVLRSGLAMAEQDSVVFSYLGLNINANEQVTMSVDKNLRETQLTNDGSQALRYQLMLDYAAGAVNNYGRMAYGPIELAMGARQAVRLHLWPDVSTVQLMTDVDNDDVYDTVVEVSGNPLPLPTNPGQNVDMSVSKIADTDLAQPGELVGYSATVTNNGFIDAPSVLLDDQISSHGELKSASATQGSCSFTQAQLHCEIGTLAAGASATVNYSVLVHSPGELLNQAIVSSAYNDIDWTNNSATVAVTIPVWLDIEPKNSTNNINLKSKGVIPAAVLGSEGFDVTRINTASIQFGELQIGVGHPDARHFEDVNGDGYLDQVFHFGVQESALDNEMESVCLNGQLHNGNAFIGCDSIKVK